MAKTSIRVKVVPKKSRGGTIVAKQVIRFKKGNKGGTPVFQTKAQLNVHLSSNGQPRP